MEKRIAVKTASCLFMTSLLWAAPSRRETTRADAAPSTDTLTLAFPGTQGPADYEKYGRFENLGTPRYRYVINADSTTGRAALSRAVGEGIYPNTDVFKDPAYRQLMKEGKLAGNQWRFVDTPTASLNFYKWASCSEDPGVKQFYVALMLEQIGHLDAAV